MAKRRSEVVAASLLTAWTDADTAMQIVGASLGVFGAGPLDPTVVLATETPLRNALFDVLLSLVEGGALEMRTTNDRRYAFRWRDDVAVAGLAPAGSPAIDLAVPSPYLAEFDQARAERDEAFDAPTSPKRSRPSVNVCCARGWIREMPACSTCCTRTPPDPRNGSSDPAGDEPRAAKPAKRKPAKRAVPKKADPEKAPRPPAARQGGRRREAGRARLTRPNAAESELPEAEVVYLTRRRGYHARCRPRAGHGTNQSPRPTSLRPARSGRVTRSTKVRSTSPASIASSTTAEPRRSIGGARRAVVAQLRCSRSVA